MALTINPQSYIRKSVRVVPFHGWGWMHFDTTHETTNLAVPQPFRLRIEEFFSFRGELHGGIGVVEEPRHEYNSYWAMFYVHWLYKDTDFSIQIGPFHIHLGSTKPIRIADEENLPFPQWRFEGVPWIAGEGDLIAT